MPRTARILLPNYPHHIIQRGHNRQAAFAGEDVESLDRLMKRLAGRQTRFVNQLEGRSGTVREGRFKSSQLTGGNAFVDEIESRLNRCIELRGRSRQRKDRK